MPSENAKVVRQLWAAVEREPGAPWPPAEGEELDRRLRLDLFDEEIEIRNPVEFPVADEYHGHEGVRQWAREVWEVFGELHHDIVEIIELEDGETVVAVVRTRGVMRHTGLETKFRWGTVWRVRSGKVVSAHGYLTKEEAVEAAGLGQ